jgi:hypothetical protein
MGHAILDYAINSNWDQEADLLYEIVMASDCNTIRQETFNRKSALNNISHSHLQHITVYFKKYAGISFNFIKKGKDHFKSSFIKWHV